MNLNNENIDEIMFQLIEGDISGEERERLIDAIKADKIYNRQWQAWQNTVLNPCEEEEVMDTSVLLKQKKELVFSWWKYCAAASIILTLGIGVYYMEYEEKMGIVNSDSKGKRGHQLIKVPEIEQGVKSGNINDTALSFKEKIPLMAEKQKKTHTILNTQPTSHTEEPSEKEFKVGQFAESRKPDSEGTINTNVYSPQPEPGIILENTTENDDVIMTVHHENSTLKSKPSLIDKIEQRRNFLSRAFSKPRLRVLNDSNTYTNKKIILENREYKIIAGF